MKSQQKNIDDVVDILIDEVVALVVREGVTVSPAATVLGEGVTVSLAATSTDKTKQVVDYHIL